MNPCLIRICERFETIADFLAHRSPEKEEVIRHLFLDFIDCFSSLGAEKLEYPKEFQKDVKYYLQGEPNITQQFKDTEFMYLMLSDFYDFCRLTKRYTKVFA